MRDDTLLVGEDLAGDGWCGSEALRKYGDSERNGDGDDVEEKCDEQWTALRLYGRAPQKGSITRVAKEAKLESSQSFVMNYHGGFFGFAGLPPQVA